MNYSELTDAAEAAVSGGRLLTALTLYGEGLTRFPEHTLYFAYNLGALLQMYVGDGKGAREAYQQALAGRRTSDGLLRPYAPNQLEADACENSMLLSLSFDEYEGWAERLEKLNSSNPILRVQRPRIRELRERGHGWHMAMLSLAKTGYDADPARDPGRYAASASILQLLLLNRRQLRVPRDDHRFAVATYAALAVQACGVCGMAMARAGREDLHECLFVAEQALPLVEEYVAANPDDSDVIAAVDNLRKAIAAGTSAEGTAALEGAAGGVSAGPGRLIVGSASRSSVSSLPVAWGLPLLGVILMTAAGYFLGPLLPVDRLLAAVASGALGAAVGLLVDRLRAWRLVGMRCTAPRWQASPELAAACRAAGVQGLRFELEYALIDPNNCIAIRFQALDRVETDRRQNAYLALRAVASCSLPVVGAAASGIELIDRGAHETVRLGQGVEVPMIAVRRGGAVVGPLKLVGEIEGDAWWVGFEPASRNLEQWVSGTQKQVIQPLVPALDRMAGQTITLPG